MKRLIIIFLFLTSCTTTKSLFEKKNKTDTQTNTTEVGTVESKRAGDTLTVFIPSIIYKDTIIQRRGNTTTLTARYDSDGNLDLKCISDEINELRTYIKEISEEKQELTKEKTKEKESIFKPIFILYLFLGLAFLMFSKKIIDKFIP
jgi:hypothetical protein